MRKLRIALCALCLMLLVPLALHAWRTLPLDTRPLVAEKYAGWSGVLRLWVFEGWTPGSGSISPWLNRCVAQFEKGHPGVYVQPQFVDADAIAALNDSGILPPDMVLVPPGLLDSPAGLAELNAPDALRPGLAGLGNWGGGTYAVPVALGGYLWAYNAQLLDGIPRTWLDADAVLSVPEPERWRRWDAALLALCSGRYADSPSTGESDALDVVPPGLDLGLDSPATPTPLPSPTPAPGDTRPFRLPEDFQYDDEAWRHFINGESAAMPVTQREVRRLQALSEQGRGPDWRLARGAAAFTDQLLFLAVVDRADAAERQALCREFIDCLLSDECQAQLCRAVAFAVTDAPSGYGAGDPLAAMDAALREPSLGAPRCFDEKWTEAVEDIVRDFISNSEDSSTLWECLRAALSKNPND